VGVAELERRPLRKSAVSVSVNRIQHGAVSTDIASDGASSRASSAGPLILGRGTATVIGEEPLEIRVVDVSGESRQIAITMRTPGNDFELAVGFLVAEGIITDPSVVRSVAYCTKLVGPVAVEQEYNIVTVGLNIAVADDAVRRSQTMSSSCGICGTTALDAIELALPSRLTNCSGSADGNLEGQSGGLQPTMRVAEFVALPDRLRSAQGLFDRTGGVHAAGLYQFDGTQLVVREDVGRHNAVDKCVGWATLAKFSSLSEAALFVSGRISFEIVQKAAMSGIALLGGVSAPTSLAIDAADRFGMTLAGFVRNGQATVYSNPERLV
jgi:FdhD protein